MYGPVTAQQVSNALGFNCNPANAWEFAAVQAMGGKWCRWDGNWSGGMAGTARAGDNASAEIQNMPSNTSGGFRLTGALSTGLLNAAAYRIHPMITADYGPPYSTIATGVLSSTLSAGATVLTLNLTSGALNGFVAGQTAVSLPNGFISSKHGYAGVIATAASGNAIRLAAAATQTIPAGTPISVNLLLYPPVLVTTGQNYLGNASLAAYANFAHSLAQQIAAAGLTGSVELWNEPPWSDECWDDASNCYDSLPNAKQLYPGVGMEIPAYMATQTPVQNVKYVSGYTDKSGDDSLANPQILGTYPPMQTAQVAFSGEMYHPYANDPEDHTWLPQCLAQYKTLASYAPALQNCTPAGMVQGSETWAEAFNNFPAAHGGLPQGITEMGLSRTLISPTPKETQVTRFHLRQFLSSAGDSISPILFYRVYDPSSQGFGFYSAQGAPYPVATALGEVMTELGSIANAPVGPYSSCMVPTVKSFRGTYPLAMVPVAGAAPGAKANSWIVYYWQRSYTGSLALWTTLPSPASSAVSIAIPAGLSVASVKDTVTSTAVSFSASGGTLTFQVADDPIEVLYSPNSGTTAQVNCN